MSYYAPPCTPQSPRVMTRATPGVGPSPRNFIVKSPPTTTYGDYTFVDLHAHFNHLSALAKL